MILGIDFGLRNIGLAVSAGQLAEPLEQFKYLDLDKALEKLAEICQLHQVKKIVVGLPDGPIVSQVKDFSNQLKTKTQLPVIFQDENLTSKQAIVKSLHMGQQKRRGFQHAIAASLILQEYIDSHEVSLVELR